MATLLAIAKYFDTTTDALLGYAPEAQHHSLTVKRDDVKLYTSYPEVEENVTGRIILTVDTDGKITAAFSTVNNGFGFTVYTRVVCDPYDEASTVFYEWKYWNRRGEFVTERRAIELSERGFIVSLSTEDFSTKQIMEFIIPEEHHAFLDPSTHPNYYYGRMGKHLFDVLKRGELDHITVELAESELIFKKPSEAVDPMQVSIEALTKLVRRELQKEHDRKIDALTERIDDLEDEIEELKAAIEEKEEE